MKKQVFAFLFVIALLAGSLAAANAEPITLADGKPLVGVYYFTHWWDPWKSSDEKILDDFAKLKKMGFNTVFLDSEWSQMIDRDWYWLDRGQKLAKKAGMQILPWLSLKDWVDISDPGRSALIKSMYGVDLDIGTGIDGGRGRTKPYDPGVIETAVRYSSDYIDRYIKNGAILHVMHNGKLCPVVALTCELEWGGSFDPVTQQMFRLWLRAKYAQDIKKLNKAWRTDFADFADIDLTNQKIFDQAAHFSHKAEHPNAVEDQVEFRAEVVDTGLAEIKARLRKKYPDLLIATEMPYQINASHPDAIGYRINAAMNPSAAHHADILVVRATGSLNRAEEKSLVDYRKQTGAQVVLAYRSQFNWGSDLLSGKWTQSDMNRLFADQAARVADGFGIYSWNEMVDVHMMPDGTNVTEDGSAAIMKALPGMVDAYARAAEMQSK